MSMTSTRSASPLVFQSAQNPDAEEWLKEWESVWARGVSDSASKIQSERLVNLISIDIDLIDSPVVAVESETSVEEACEVSGVDCPFRIVPGDEQAFADGDEGVHP